MSENKKAGRPRKPTTDNDDPKLVKKRLYMRKYTGEIKKDILELSQMEEDCDKELKEIKKEKKKLLDELEKANKQASSILAEATSKAKPKK
jgi:F0F1-type ATP synthase membrane subunit b/b'